MPPVRRSQRPYAQPQTYQNGDTGETTLMPPVRRSQRLCTQPQGHQNGHAGEGDRKRTSKTSYNEKARQSLETKRFRLTEKNLREHRKQENAMGRKRKTPSNTSGTKSTGTTNTTTTDPQFGNRIIQNGVVFERMVTRAPRDCKEVKTALAQARDLPLSTAENCQDLFHANREMVLNELTFESDIIRFMLDLYKRPHRRYWTWRNDQWTEVDNEITAGISDPKPDVTQAYSLAACPVGTAEDFEELIPTQHGYLMPTFAMESKGYADPSQAEKQAAYDGANMTYSAIAAETQMGHDEKELYLKTKAITVSLTPIDIGVYANHAVRDESNGKVTYHHYCVERIRYLESEEDWNKACTVLINAQEFAFGLADARVRALEKYFKQRDERLKSIKAKQEELQATARADVEAAKLATPVSRTGPSNTKIKTNSKQEKLPAGDDGNEA